MSLKNPKHRRAAALFVAAATMGGVGLGMTAAMAADTVLVPSITGVTPLIVAADTADITVTIKGKNLTTALVKSVALGADPRCANLTPTFGTGTNAGKLLTVTTPEGGCNATATGTEIVKLKNPADVTAVDEASCPAEEEPSESPSAEPSESPSEEPSESPSAEPTPTEEPSGAAASEEPTPEPTESPSESPSASPTPSESTPAEEEEPAEEEPALPFVCEAGTAVATFTSAKSVKFVTAIEVDDVLLENGAGADDDLRLTKIGSAGGQLVRVVATDAQTWDAKPTVTVAGNAKLKLSLTKVSTDKTYAVFKTPKGLTAGALKLDVTNKGVKTANVETGLTVAALPAVTGVSPNFGPYAAEGVEGATVVVKGSGWAATPTADNTRVKVCGETATFVTTGKAKNDAKQLTVKVPAVPESVETAEAVCAVTVEVKSGTGDSATWTSSQLSGGSVFAYIAH